MTLYHGEDLPGDVAVNGIDHHRRTCFVFRNIGTVRSDHRQSEIDAVEDGPNGVDISRACHREVQFFQSQFLVLLFCIFRNHGDIPQQCTVKV